ncbi:MAG: carboxypeptidase regulatory-like domain-containing protein, partial [Candidatus Thermoplasmatota archaeon]|nr:carboxypeptidase regulatory-like domain-containing protein [Candidatus Thermoplasmatota archaeon]
MSSRLLGSLTAGKKKPSSGPSWLEKHWDTTVVLLGIFIIAMMVRAYFAYETATEFGLPYLLGGGADSHYNARIINYIAEYNEHLFTDPLRAYPLEGKVNTRPPLYQWSIVLGGYLLLPFVGNLDKAINHSFILSSAFWGALTVFPIYLIGKRTFGKKAGIAGAFLLAISAAHLERGVLTNTNHDAFSMFLIVTTFFFFMRSLEEITAGRKWVSDWMKLDEIKKGLSRYLGSNKKSMLYAAMTGITTGAIALTWKGYSYAVVIILVYFLIQLFIDKFREKDSLGITVNIFIIFMIAFLIALPWYAMYSPKILTDWFSWPLNRWFQVPFIIFLGTFGIGVYFTVTRDLPWLLTFSIIIAAGVIFFTLGPDVIQTAAGQYFIENKMYATIAEAQPPMFSRLVLAGGLATFFLSWVGIALAAWHLRIEWTRSFVFILIWTAFAIYMTTTAVRFIFNAAPAFALTAGWVLALVFDKTGFDEIGRYFRRRRGSVLIRIKEGVKIKHVLVTLLIVFLLLTPNALYAIDAGIPYEEKQRYEEQIYDTLPSFLRPPDYNPEDGGYHYLGAFGYTMDKPTEYWPTAWEDLRQQNKDIPPEERPAFLSWWDYGFEAMNQGEHPTVADNFQHAHRFAGNFLMAQNESEMMALLVGRQLQLPYSEEGGFEGRVEEILIEHIGEEKTEELEDIYRNPASYRNEVLSNPDRYHPRADDIDNVNIRWAMVMGTLSYENLDTLSSLYRSISFDSGYERLENRIGYFAVDSRMFPTSARDTGIFHAPAFLSGHRVDESGRGRVPIDFYKMVFVDQQGRTYESQEEIPQDAQIVDQRIEFQPMFYNSALYRIFAGYNLEEIGEEKGIPGIDNQDSQRSRPRDQPKEPKPGWNFTHFNEFHRTAYFNPYPRDEVQNHTDAWRAMPYREAIEYARDENVTVDLSGRSYMGQGVIFLRYFDGAILEGQVRTEDGEPIPNAKVTVLDTNTSGRYPTPQHTSRTDEDGRYRAILPEGNITVMVSTGGDGEEVIKQEQIVLGSEQFEINEEQAMRRRTDKDGDGRWDYQLEKDFEVQSGQISGKVFLDREGTGEYDEQNDTVVSSVGEVRMKNEFSEVNYALDIEDGNYEFDRAIPGIYTVNTTIPGSESSEGVEVNPGEKTNRDIPVSTGNITGSVNFEEEGLEGETVTLSLRSMDRTKDVVLGEMRNFKFENIPPGEYTLEIENEDYTLSQGPQVIEMVEGESIERFVTVVSAHRVEGVIKEGGARIPNQRLNIFTKEYDRDIITDDEGEFSIKLPRGHYNIYGVNRQGTEVSAYLDDVLVEGDIANYEGVFEDAHKLSGTAEYKEQGADKAEIFVIDGSGSEYHMTTNQEGRF